MKKPKTLGERLRYARTIRGMSRRQVSLAAGLSQSMTGAIEREPDWRPLAQTIAALAATLNVDPAWLLTGRGAPPR